MDSGRSAKVVSVALRSILRNSMYQLRARTAALKMRVIEEKTGSVISALGVVVAVHADFVGMVQRQVDPMFGERTNSVLTELVLDDIGVAAQISSEAPQVADMSDDLRADRLVGFFADREVNIGGEQRFDVTRAVTFSPQTR